MASVHLNCVLETVLHTWLSTCQPCAARSLSLQETCSCTLQRCLLQCAHHVPPEAGVAEPAAGDVVDHDPCAGGEGAARAGHHHPAAGLVPRHHRTAVPAYRGLRSLPLTSTSKALQQSGTSLVLAVDGADVAAADSTGQYPHPHLHSTAVQTGAGPGTWPGPGAVRLRWSHSTARPPGRETPLWLSGSRLHSDQ